MRAAATIIALASACGAAGAAPGDVVAKSTNDPARASLHRGQSLFFPMDEAVGDERIDRIHDLSLLAWQRTGYGQYAVDGRGTTAVEAAVGMGQHIAGAQGYHFATYHDDALRHDSGSFTWAGWVSIDAADGDDAYTSDQTWLAKWNGIPDTGGAPPDHREYRVWLDHASQRFRFEVSADGLEGDEHSASVAHSLPVERDQLYFLEAFHDADAQTINLRVSTQRERGETASEAWRQGVFAGGADLDVGAQNTCTDAHLRGVVDALGYWTRVLDEDESAALWNSGAGLELFEKESDDG